MPSELTTIWIRNRTRYPQRVAILEQAITNLRKGNLNTELQEAAQREAHILRGSLGSFGLVGAVSLSREIEEMLQTGNDFTPSLIEHLCDLIEALRQALEQSIDESLVP